MVATSAAAYALLMTRIPMWASRTASAPLVLLILFEEWGWEPLGRLMARIARLRAIARAERAISALPPVAALVAYALPWLLLLPLKVLALWLIGDGQALLGCAVVIIAKVLGTAVVARLFTLTKPALLRLAWFAALYGRWSAWKSATLRWVRESGVWHQAAAIRRSLRRHWEHWRARVAT
jgi:hypothetical protein